MLAFTTIVVGGVTHRRVIKQLVQSFDFEMESSRVACKFLQTKFEETEKTRDEFLRNEGALKENLRIKRGKIQALQNRITELETEILRLKDPIAVAAREASIARLEGESEIMDGVKNSQNRYEY